MQDARLPENYTTFVDLLQRQFHERAGDLAFRFLLTGDVDGPIEEWTYRDLGRRVFAIATRLQQENAEGNRALLLYPPGLEFIAAFLGCMYAGVVAVPTYPHRKLSRLEAIAQDCRASLVLTTSQFLKISRGLSRKAPELADARWIATDDGAAIDSALWRRPTVTSETLAFLQYTSGSTGTPKGVMVTHGNILANEQLIAQSFGNDSSAHVVGWLPLYHDMGLIGNVLQPLYLGTSCTLMSPLAMLQRPMRWLEAISRFHGTVSGGPNFSFDLCTSRKTPDLKLDLSAWKVAFNGSEPVRQETMERFSAAFASCGFRAEAFYPCYGLAEGTLFVTGIDRDLLPSYRTISSEGLERNLAIELTAGTPGTRTLVSSGRSGPQQRVLIVDPSTHEVCSEKTVGEIWVAGPSVAKGYWGRGDENTYVFCAQLLRGDSTPFLRTGDLGFETAGEIFVTGRMKDLIIIRGRNIYPQDIELTVEKAHSAVRAGGCAAFALESGVEEQLAIAAEVDLPGDSVDPETIVESIRRAVAEEHGTYVNTVALLRAKSIPKTSSGKIRRNACRKGLQDGDLLTLFVSRTGNSDGMEFAHETLAAIELDEDSGAVIAALVSADDHAKKLKLVEDLVRVLCARRLRVDASRVDLALSPAGIGLDSLMGIVLQTELESSLGLLLPDSFIWQHTALTDVAKNLLELWCQGQSSSATEAITPGPLEGELPVSSGQQRLWFLDRLSPGNPVYNVHFGLRIAGQLDHGLLRRSLVELSCRHSILRTVFRDVNGQPFQIVQPGDNIGLTLVDLRAIEPAQRERELYSIATNVASQPFDLAVGPLVRFHLVAISENEHALLITQHHTVTDGWSIMLLAKELATIYRNLARDIPVPPPMPLQFADYARWEQSRNAEWDNDRSFWTGKLKDLPRLELPGDRSHSTEKSYRGGRLPLNWTRELSEKLVALGREENCTPFVVLLAGYAVFLGRYSSQKDFAIGSFVANRGRNEFQGLIGFLANTIVLRCDLSGGPTFRELLQRIRQTVSDALLHGKLPFGEIVRAAESAREGDENPLFQASFVLESSVMPEMDVPSLTWQPLSWAPDGAVEGTAKFDLSLALLETPQGFTGTLEYSSDRFEVATVQRFIRHMTALFSSIGANSDRDIGMLPMLLTEEQQQLLVQWNSTASDVPLDECFHQRFESQVDRTPDAVAVSDHHRQTTYKELNRQANRLAHQLRKSGVGPESIVGLLMDRSIEFLAAMLAVFKAGGAYLPLDPAHPVLRHIQVLERSGVVHLVGNQELVRELEQQLETSLPGTRLWAFHIEKLGLLTDSDENLRALHTPEHLAYVIYTSGSTGTPKGAMVEHAGMLNHLWAKVHDLQLGPADVIAQTASQCFDISVWQFLAALLVGGRVNIVAQEIAIDPYPLFQNALATGTTVLEVVPSLLRAFLEGIESKHTTPVPLSALRWLVLTGEALPPELVRRWFDFYKATPIVNAYGPTECSDDVAHYLMKSAEPPDTTHTPIGNPILNTRLYVLDEYFQPVPVGVAGELYVGGICVGRGYLNDPVLTAQAFIPDSYSTTADSRLYRTGDLARRLPEGEIVFLGRTDHQVKVRGFRIELGEIENVLEAHPAVAQAVVTVYEDSSASKRLVAYLVPRHQISGSQLRDAMKQRLPEYMVPAVFVMMEEMPLTANGKINRQALPEVDENSWGKEGYRAPRTPVEELIGQIWEEVLGIERVGAEDDFFARGGHSLLATQVIARVRASLGVELPLRAVFEAPKVWELAQRVEEARGG
ncbi:MAG: amino acid adenylation domain-containing protein, partial [Acidobacteriia bacterium]|nr:amino acid adenylation domain-containing protein [Terriglobia bacterium]